MSLGRCEWAMCKLEAVGHIELGDENHHYCTLHLRAMWHTGDLAEAVTPTPDVPPADEEPPF